MVSSSGGASRAHGVSRVSASGWLLALAALLRSPAAHRRSAEARVGRAAARRHRRLRIRSTACRPVSFRRWCDNLNDEAQTRQLAVIVARQPAAYRVRGYLAAKVSERPDDDLVGLGRVSTANQQRALRITGEETAEGRRAMPGPSPTTRCCAGSPATAWTSLPPS